ncbi:MAG: hypothetical protein RLZZ175_3274 [Bacteroidota bacterium]|jgi:hypothetical protein
MKKWLVVCLGIMLFSQAVWANKYWVFLKSKNQVQKNTNQLVSDFTLNHRNQIQVPLFQVSDFPVNTVFQDSLCALGAKIRFASKWLNAISIEASNEIVELIKHKSYVASVQAFDKRLIITTALTPKNTNKFSPALEMMGGENFVNAGMNAKGVRIGIMDAGFNLAPQDSMLSHIFKKNNVIAVRDFLLPRPVEKFYEVVNEDDDHGKDVFECIAGVNLANKHLQTGLATEAQFLLARTENTQHEYRGEEDLWVKAMEWMDSVGVHVISTSLGYATDMDDTLQNYKPSEMNGKTSVIARAADIAVKEKGIFLVISAGNEGSKPDWNGYLTTPGDAESALTVGAHNGAWLKAYYSSIGPEYNTYLKPNVSTFSSNGTSFSAPAVAGFVACVKAKAMNMKPLELKALIEKSGDLWPYGNNYLGYGAPQADRIIALLENKDTTFNNTQAISTFKELELKIEDTKIFPIAIFHKKNHVHVLEQDEPRLIYKKTFWQKVFRIKPKHAYLVVKQPDGAKFTTLLLGNQLFEITWE